ncbi:MAG: beta strand repeat-containing protein, partial [Verrucomicrobiales bacterium]
MKPRILSSARRSLPLATAIAAMLASQSVHAANATWGANANSAWLTGTNWAGGASPGATGSAASNTDVATFTSAATGTAFGINMNTASNYLNLGAISIDSTRTTNTTIGNSSTTAISGNGQVLRLYGASVGGVANTILSNAGSGLLTIQNTQGSGNQFMGVVLSNTTNNVINAGGNITISSIISQSASGNRITKSGAGTLTLSGANTYTGGTTLSAGTVSFTGTGLGSTGNITFSGNSTLQWGASTTTDLSARLVINNGITATLNTGGNNVTLATGFGASGSGALAKAGTGTLTLSVANSYSGQTTIGTNAADVGTVNITNGSALGSGTVSMVSGTNGAAALTLNSGSGITVANNFNTSGEGQGGNGIIRNVTGNNVMSGTFTLTTGGGGTRIHSDGGSLTLQGNISPNATGRTLLLGGSATGTISGNINNGSGSNTLSGVTKQGTGTWTLSGSNGYTGTTTISEGTLEIQGSIASSSGITNNAALVFNSGSTQSYGNAIGGTGTLTKQGAGTLTLGGSNGYTGATLVSGGTLAFSGTGASNSSSGITVNGGGAKLLQTSSTAIAPTVTLTNGTLTGNGTVNTVNVGAGTGGIISNNNGVAGAALTIGTLTFSGAATVNTFHSSGDTSAAIVATSLTTNAAGTVTINATSASWANNTTYNLIDYSGSIGGEGFAKFALGTVNLSARQNASLVDDTVGTAITLSITGDAPKWTGALGSEWSTATLDAPKNWVLQTAATATDFLANDDVTFDDTATNFTPDISSGNVSPANTTFNNSTSYTLSGTGGFGIASGNLTKNGTGIVTISSVNTYTGATTINAGTIAMSGSGTLGTGSALTLGGGALDLGTTSQTVGAVSITAPATSGDTIGNGSLTGTSRAVSNTTGNAIVSANLLGTGGLTKSGAGTLTLSGANTYSGVTTVSGGTLGLTGSLINASLGNIVVQAGGTLDVSGTISGNTGTTNLSLFGSPSGIATVNVSTGANITLAAMPSGTTASAVSVYNQTGGSVTVGTAGSAEAVTLANAGYGYMGISGGSYSVLSRLSVENGNPGQGVLRVGGGAGAATFSVGDLLALGRGASGTGELTVLPNGSVTFNGTGTQNFLLTGNATNNTGLLNIVGGTVTSVTKA